VRQRGEMQSGLGSSRTLLAASGLQHQMTVDLHSPPLESFFAIPVEYLSAGPLLEHFLNFWRDLGWEPVYGLTWARGPWNRLWS
jgi:hypothetical protein